MEVVVFRNFFGKVEKKNKLSRFLIIYVRSVTLDGVSIALALVPYCNLALYSIGDNRINLSVYIQ